MINRSLCVSEYASLLRQCRTAKSLHHGKQLHERLISSGQDQQTYLGNLIVEMYGRCERTEEAWRAFQRIQVPNVYSWTILIAAYARNGQLREAKSALDRMPEIEIVSWNVMVSAYAQQDHPAEALHLLEIIDLEGIRPDAITFLSLADACGELKDLPQGKRIHARVLAFGLESHLHLANSLVRMYSRCGCIRQATDIFDRMTNRDLISWNTILAAKAQNGRIDQALDTFEAMEERDVASWNTLISSFTQAGFYREALNLLARMDQEGSTKPDDITFISSLDASAGLSAVAEGSDLHTSIAYLGLESKLQIATSLINMYGKCGFPERARNVFDKTIGMNRDLILWNAMIAAYASSGSLPEVLDLIQLMDLEGVEKSGVSHINVLSGFSHGGTFEDGCGYFVRMSLDYGLVPGFKHFSCMIDLLARAGKLDDAEELIACLPFEPDVVSLTSLLSACKLHKDSKRAAKIAERIQELDSESVVSISKFCVQQG